jgi:hypothetical protein
MYHAAVKSKLDPKTTPARNTPPSRMVESRDGLLRNYKAERLSLADAHNRLQQRAVRPYLESEVWQGSTKRETNWTRSTA